MTELKHRWVIKSPPQGGVNLSAIGGSPVGTSDFSFNFPPSRPRTSPDQNAGLFQRNLGFKANSFDLRQDRRFLFSPSELIILIKYSQFGWGGGV